MLLAGVMFAASAQLRSSFEGGDFSGWTTQGEGWSIYEKAASAGVKSAMCTVSKGDAPGLKACVMVIKKAEPGWVIKAELDVAGKVKSNSSKVSLAVLCIDEAGNTLQEVKKQITAPTAEFKKVILSELVIPTGTAEAYFMIVVEVSKEAKAKEWWRFDNVVIELK